MAKTGVHRTVVAHMTVILTLVHFAAGFLNDNFILVADSGRNDSSTVGLYQIDMQTGNSEQILPEIPSNIIAVAYYPLDQTVFYSNVKQNRILKYSPQNRNTSVVYQETTDASHFDGLVFDYVNSKLYYSDTRLLLGVIHIEGIIGEIDVRNNAHKLVLKYGQLKPRALQVDGYNRKLYFTDWDSIPGIYEVSLDSQTKDEIVRRIVSTELYWPNGLAIDFRARVMYWADVRPGSLSSRIEMANLDGTGRRILLEEQTAHYYGLALDSTYLYVTDWNYNKVRTIHRSSNELSIVSSPRNFEKLHGIYAYASDFLPNSSNTATPAVRKTHSTQRINIPSKLSSAIPSSTSTIASSTVYISPTLAAAGSSTSRTSTESATNAEEYSLHSTMMQAANNPLIIVSAIVIIVTVIIAITICCVVKKRRNRRQSSVIHGQDGPMGAITKNSLLGEEYCYIPADHFSARRSAHNETEHYLKPVRENEDNDKVQNIYERPSECFQYSKLADDPYEREGYLKSRQA